MYQCNLYIDHIDTFFLYHSNLKDYLTLYHNLFMIGEILFDVYNSKIILVVYNNTIRS